MTDWYAICDMRTMGKNLPLKPARHRVTDPVSTHGIKAVPGNPFVGLEHYFGSVSLRRDRRSRRTILRARYRADHNT